MSLQITTGSNILAGTRHDLQEVHDLFVGKNGVVAPTDESIAVKGTGSGHNVDIQGTVVALKEVMSLGDGWDDYGQSLLIGEDGLVATIDPTTGTTSVVVMGDGSFIDNRGTIRGGNAAISVGGDSDFTPITFLNSGVIEARNFGVGTFGTATVDFTNTGVVRVSSPNGLSYFGGQGKDQIVNNGLMSGGIELSPGDDLYDGRGGRVIGEVSGSSGADKMYGGSFADVFKGGEGKDVLDGGGGNDTLDGGLGADSMLGGAGNDVFVVDDAGDVVSEAGGSGIDTVNSSVSFSLANATRAIGGVDHLFLTGDGAINATGNALANMLVGNGAANVLGGGAGNDTLVGGSGNDTLTGGGGADTVTGGVGADIFVFNAAPSVANADTIVDFSPPQDTFHIENGVMGKVGTAGFLNPGFFRAGATAADANDYVVYNKATGALFYDSNGNAAGGAVQIATLTNKPVLTADDFVVI